jgi:CHAD domain-containing protein
MSYSLRSARPVDSEVKRIVDKQLAHAVEQLRSIGDSRSDEAVHEARRHVKKVRAMIRLVQPALGDDYDAIDRRMRVAGRMLAPIADGRAVVATISRLKNKYRGQLAPQTLASVGAVLLERAARIDRKASRDRVLPRVAALLRAERQRLHRWDLNTKGFRAIEAGLEKSVRRAREAMARAATNPTADHYHSWRRRVKDLWFEVRLIQPRCGNQLAPMQRRLETLDGVLGEYHNVVLVEQVLVTEALVSRQQTARCLRLLRRYQAELRHRALSLGHRVFAEKPRRLVRRVKTLWKAVAVGRQWS